MKLSMIVAVATAGVMAACTNAPEETIQVAKANKESKSPQKAGGCLTLVMPPYLGSAGGTTCWVDKPSP